MKLPLFCGYRICPECRQRKREPRRPLRRTTWVLCLKCKRVWKPEVVGQPLTAGQSRGTIAAGPTIRKQIMLFLKWHPDKTATQVARSIKRRPSSVSSILHRDYKNGLVQRRLGGGPRRGMCYSSYSEAVIP